ncbi:MAG: lamin tail domain-containing protein [Candidatus Cloacimonetes bacterium]|nr:lamin tail domain-containing protein [Candidatus Cloacimonadota bacterium]
MKKKRFSVRKTIVVIALIYLSSNLGAQALDLFVSEYVEGSSYNKALEVFNGTGSPIDLSEYSLRKQTNGAGDFGSTFTLSGTLENNEVFVVCHNSANDDIQNIADATSSVCNFNGNDAVGLFKNGNPIDIIGIVDSADDWGKNVTLVRMENVYSPTVNYDETEWESFDEDNIDNLGSHVFDGGPTDPMIIVTSPNGGEEWQRSTTHLITWNSMNFEGNIDIELTMVYNRTREMLASDIENNGEWEWNIPETQELSDYYVIIVSGVDEGDPSDDSDSTFSIIEFIVIDEYTIYEIQYSETGESPLNGELIRTTGVVTAVFYNSFYIQDGTGAWNGICVYPQAEQDIVVGDLIQLHGTVDEYNGKTELVDYMIEENFGQTTIPEPVTILSGDMATEEMYEGVLVRIYDVTVTNADMGYGEWEIDDLIDSSGPCVVDDLGEYEYIPMMDDVIFSVTGVVDYTFETYKLEPRTDEDINFGGLEVNPLFLDFFTIEDCIDGKILTIQNVSNDPITISNITQSGTFGQVTEWLIENWTIELPYELAPENELILNIIVELPVYDGDRDVVSDILHIASNVGDVDITIYFQTDLISDADDENVEQVSHKLLGNYPNPFNPETIISFLTTKNSKDTKIEIYNTKGQKIKILKISPESIRDKLGKNEVVWNGTDESEKAVSSGIYFYKLQIDGFSQTKKMILMK